MGAMTLPPGFRFHPTDDELVAYYLKRKVDGLKIELEVIPVIELYKFDPWELPDKSFLPKRDMEWFFFCPRDRKYPNGSRTNRATASGYWKATGKDRKVFCEASVQGLRKTLVFYRGRAPGGERTDWVMHEYRLCEDFSQGTNNFVGAFALCRVVKRNEHGQKIGNSLGESKAKRSLPSTGCDDGTRKYFSKVLSTSEEHSSRTSHLIAISDYSSPVHSPSEDGRGTESQPIMMHCEETDFCGSIVPSDASKVISLEESIMSESTIPSQLTNSGEDCTNLSHVSSYDSFTDNSDLVDETNWNSFFASFPSPQHGMSMCYNEEDMALQCPEWEMPLYMNPPINGFEACNAVVSPSICRQASEVEEAMLWLQEDSLMVVM